MPPPCTACGDQKSSPRNILLTCIQCERPWHHRCHRPVVPDAELVQIIRRFKEQQNKSQRLQWKCVACTSKNTSASTVASESVPHKRTSRKDVVQLPSASASASISASTSTRSQYATGSSRTTKSTQAPKKREPSPIVIDDDSEDEIKVAGSQPTHVRDHDAGRSTAANSVITVSSTSSRGTPTLSATSSSAFSSRAASTSTEEIPIITTRHPYTAMQSASTQPGGRFHPLSQIPSRPTDVKILDHPFANTSTSESRLQTIQPSRSSSTVSRDLIPDFRDIVITPGDVNAGGRMPTLADGSEKDIKPSVGLTISAESNNQPALIPAWINAHRASENVSDMWDRVAARRKVASGRRRRKDFVAMHILSAEQAIDPKGKGKARALNAPRPHGGPSTPFYFSANIWMREKLLELHN